MFKLHFPSNIPMLVSVWPIYCKN